ncbi:MAG: DUF362 domain-containing protein, partial [Clostridiales bacterium]|nr:DUF362 domain-containing protein [Clostridiales bacterium]
MIEQSLNLPILSAASLLEGDREFSLPDVVPLRQRFSCPQIDDLPLAVRACCVSRGLQGRIKRGMRIAIAVGSRGISGEVEIVRALIDYLVELGAKPAIIPAMGSHGGPSAAGQRELLAGYGISETAMNVPVISSLEVKELGRTTGGLTVWYAADALKFDGVIVVNRVKPHTDFCGSIESGLMKMCAVGLGKHRGASYIHSLGFAQLGESIKQVARLMLQKA